MTEVVAQDDTVTFEKNTLHFYLCIRLTSPTL